MPLEIPACALCGQGPVSVVHAILHCPAVQDDLSNVLSQVGQAGPLSEHSALQLLFGAFGNVESLQVTITFVGKAVLNAMRNNNSRLPLEAE